MTAAPAVTLRRAAPEDAVALAHLHVRVWEDAYGGLLPPTIFERRRATIDDRVERWRRIVTESPAPTTVAVHEGAIVGFVNVGPARDDDLDVHTEVWSLYVDAAWWGRGVGHRLLEHDLGDRTAYLWVLEGNDRAIAFYRAHGFAPDGATQPYEGRTELRMVRRSGG